MGSRTTWAAGVGRPDSPVSVTVRVGQAQGSSQCSLGLPGAWPVCRPTCPAGPVTRWLPAEHGPHACHVPAFPGLCGHSGKAGTLGPHQEGGLGSECPRAGHGPWRECLAHSGSVRVQNTRQGPALVTLGGSPQAKNFFLGTASPFPECVYTVVST